MGSSNSKNEQDGPIRKPKRLKTTFLDLQDLQFNDIDLIGKTRLHEPYEEPYEFNTNNTSYNERAKHRIVGCYRGFKKCKAAEDEAAKRDLEEIEVLGIMDHPNILKTHELYESDGYKCAWYQFLIGSSLSDFPMAGNPLKESEAAYFIHSLLRALNYMHQREYMHRDIQPRNITFDTNDRDKILKLTNFKQVHRIPKKARSEITCESSVYQAPELDKGKYDEKIDIYSTGMILLWMLNGQITKELVDDIKKGKRIVLEKYMSVSISIKARDFILKLIDTNPEKRYSAAQALENNWLLDQLSTRSSMFISSLNYCLDRWVRFDITSNLAALAWIVIVQYHLNVDDLSKVSKGFMAADQGDNGILSEDQIKDLLKPLAEKAVENGLLEDVDEDDLKKDGGEINHYLNNQFRKYAKMYNVKNRKGVTFQTFLTMCVERSDYTSVEYSEAAFRCLDVDRDGKITTTDLTELRKSNRILGLNSEFWNDAINETYETESGIPIEEFQIIFKSFLKRPSEREKESKKKKK